MHDFHTLKALTDSQLQDLMRNIDRKLGGVSPNNPGLYETLLQQKDLIAQEVQERQQIKTLLQTNLKPINLTDDDLSRQEKENETQNKQ